MSLKGLFCFGGWGVTLGPWSVNALGRGAHVGSEESDFQFASLARVQRRMWGCRPRRNLTRLLSSKLLSYEQKQSFPTVHNTFSNARKTPPFPFSRLLSMSFDFPVGPQTLSNTGQFFSLPFYPTGAEALKYAGDASLTIFRCYTKRAL